MPFLYFQLEQKKIKKRLLQFSWPRILIQEELVLHTSSFLQQKCGGRTAEQSTKNR